MNRSLDLSLHGWRGIGPDIEPDLFLIRWRLGFLTIGFCRVCVLDRFRELQALVDEYARRRDYNEGR